MTDIYADDTPRSVAYGSPRDDRFYTPRTIARTNSINSNSNSDSSNSPRTPRFETPRNGGYASTQSDAEFQTPRQTPRPIQSTVMPNYSQNKISNRNVQQLKTQDVPKPNEYKASLAAPKSINILYQSEQKSSFRNNFDDNKNENKANDEVKEVGINFIERDSYNNEPSDNIAAYESMGLSEADVEDIFSYARHGRCEEVDRLLDRGIPVDVRDNFGNTVLIIACQNGNKRVTKSVLRRGANINARNHKGNTPLHYCYHYGYGDSLGQYIVTKGADIDTRNRAGKLPWEGI